MKVFRNIALLLLFSVSTNSFAGIETLLRLSGQLYEGPPINIVSGNAHQDSALGQYEKKNHEPNIVGIILGAASGKFAFTYREAMGDKSANKVSHIKKHEEEDDDNDLYLSEYRKFYRNKVSIIEDILASKFSTEEVHKFHELSDKDQIFFIELCGCIAISPSSFPRILDKKKAELFLNFIENSLVQPKIETHTTEMSKKYLGKSFKFILRDYESSIVSLNSIDDYLDGIVNRCVKYRKYPTN